MAGQAGADFPVRGIGSVAGRIPDRCRIDAVQLPELAFRAPEAPHPEHRTLEAVWKRRLKRMLVDEVRLRHRHALGATRQCLGLRRDGWRFPEEHGAAPICPVGLEPERRAVHAVTQARRPGSVRKYVSKMSAASRAVNFRSCHAVALVDGRLDRSVDRLPEAGPAGAALELGVRRKQRMAAAAASERAGALLVIQGAGPRTLGSVLPQHAKLLRRERPPPLLLGPGLGFVVHPFEFTRTFFDPATY